MNWVDGGREKEMSVYYGLALILTLGCVFNEGLSCRTTPILKQVKARAHGEKVFYILCCAYMLALVAFRGTFWTDINGYTRIFYAVSNVSIQELISSGTRYTNGEEYLFYILTKVISWFTDDQFIYFGIIAGMTYLPIFYVVAKESQAPFLSLLIVFTTGFFFSSFNVIRSCMVYGLSALLLEDIRRRRTIRYMFFAFVLSLIHSSAILLIPIYFIMCIPLLDRKHLLITAVCMVAFFVGFGYLFNIVDNLLLGGFYTTSSYSGINIEAGAVGMILPAAFVLMMLVAMVNCINWNSVDERILANGTLIWCAMGISVMAMRLMTRFSDMMFIYVALFLPRLLMKIKPNNKSQETVQRTIIFLLMALLLILRLAQTMNESPFNPYISYLEAS